MVTIYPVWDSRSGPGYRTGRFHRGPGSAPRVVLRVREVILAALNAAITFSTVHTRPPAASDIYCKPWGKDYASA
jgi:hypothetical protein